MRDHLDVYMLANWVSMLRADVDGAILLADDECEGRFYEKCKHERARVVPSPGVALNLLRTTEDRGVSGVVAAISGYVDPKNLSESVFQPDLGDVASLLLTSAAFNQTLEEIGSIGWVKAGNKEVGSVADRAILLAWLFENIRNAEFSPSPADVVGRYIDWNTFTASASSIATGASPAKADLIGKLSDKAIGRPSRDLLRECNGLFVVEILAGATKWFRPRGLQAERSVTASEFLGMLRLAFDLSDLEADQMYWRMRRWERRNAQFPLLRQWRILDSLQSVLDQRYWETDLRTLLANDPNNEGLSAFKMDLDNFKGVNEELGHSGGDEAIRLACSTLRELASASAEVYRRGGDELVALAPGLRGDAALQLAESIRDQIQSRMTSWGATQGLSVCPTASIGLVDVAPGVDANDVVRMMDEAQGRAKREGKNRVVLLQCRAHETH